MDFLNEIEKHHYLQELEIEKSTNPNLISIYDLQDLLKSGYEIENVDESKIEKAERDLSHLVKKEVYVTRNGKRFKQTVYVKIKDDEKVETPVGGEISPDVKGMSITKYSDKSILITGDTYVNKDTLRDIKKEIGVGTFNPRLKGWIYPLKYVETVLGYIWSDLKNKGEDEKADAVQNQKNAALQTGDKAEINGTEIEVKENVSDSEGTKYNVKLKDGTELNGVDEKVIEKKPEKDDKKIAEALNNASPESRVPTEKKIYGIQPIKDIHNYTLSEYMGMHGLDQTDIDKAIAAFTKPKTGDKKRSGGSGTPKVKGENKQADGLSKKQLIAKLIYAHYQAVQQAIKNGEVVKPEVLAIYADLQQEVKDRKPMSEETKRKISEALKKNKVEVPETPEIKKEKEEAEDQGVGIPDKENYQPKIEEVEINSVNGSKKHKVENYLDIPALDVYIPKQKGILDKPRPYFIPEIKDGEIKQMGFQIQAVKVADDKYLVSLDNYTQRPTKQVLNVEGSYKDGYKDVPVDIKMAYLTLDQLAATEQYYRLKEKERIKRSEDERYQSRINMYTKDGLTEKEAKEKVKRSFSRSRARILTDKKTTYNNQNLYNNAFGSRIAPPDSGSFWTHQRRIRKDIAQKFQDLEMQTEYIDSAYSKGAETSFGDKNTKDDLFKDYGVKVKRQNGDEINNQEITQIQEALNVTGKLFGHNKQMNEEFGLKISHSGNVNMHARKAIGLFHPFYNAIGVSSKYGENKFQFTFGHEYAHFMDYWIGKKTGNTYASDKEGSTAQKIADVFRENMNIKQKNAYYNRTCECFARALEEYVAIETYGKDVEKIGEKYIDSGVQVNFEIYTSKVKPLVEQFLQENKDILKGTLFDIMK